MEIKNSIEWFETLPEPYKSKAIRNHYNPEIGYRTHLFNSLGEALWSGSFEWRRSPEGYRFWEDCYITFVNKKY